MNIPSKTGWYWAVVHEKPEVVFLDLNNGRPFILRAGCPIHCGTDIVKEWKEQILDEG